MLLLILVAEVQVRTVNAGPQVQSRATVRIERGGSAGETQWKSAPLDRRREILRKGDDGKPQVLRVIDFQ